MKNNKSKSPKVSNPTKSIKQVIGRPVLTIAYNPHDASVISVDVSRDPSAADLKGMVERNFARLGSRLKPAFQFPQEVAIDRTELDTHCLSFEDFTSLVKAKVKSHNQKLLSHGK